MDKSEEMKTVALWLADISKAIESEIVLNAEGVCHFKIGDDVIAIEVSEDYPVVYLYSPLVPLPTDDKEMQVALLSRALELNAFQVVTRGGAIGMPPGGEFLIYSYSSPIEGCDSEKFAAILSAFYESLVELKHTLLGLDVDPKDLGSPGWSNFGKKV